MVAKIFWLGILIFVTNGNGFFQQNHMLLCYKKYVLI